MSRFYASMDNSRGSEVTASNPTHAHIRGWDAGVKVFTGTNSDGSRDEFEVFLTSGSSGVGSRERHLGTVRDTSDGPVWEPCERDAS